MRTKEKKSVINPFNKSLPWHQMKNNNKKTNPSTPKKANHAGQIGLKTIEKKIFDLIYFFYNSIEKCSLKWKCFSFQLK